jgi:glycosyltransferase involved in cell wall biosynthesis
MRPGASNLEAEPVRIAQVAPLQESIPPAKYGGTERVIAALTAELVALGHEVTLYASGDSTAAGRVVPIVERALWHEELPHDANMLHCAELSRVAREAGDYDVVHSHLDYMAFPFGRASMTPFVHTMHGRLDLRDQPRLFAEFRDAPLISISDSQRAPIPNANWVATVYNGVALDSYPPGHGVGDYLVFLGRISPEKGVAEAIDVALQAGVPLKIAARMPLNHVNDPCIAQDWAYYHDQVKPRLGNSLVEFVGEVADQEKADLLKDARALIFPINWPEPFGLVMVEALACGTPVIARAMGSAPEIVDHGRTGFLCSSVDEMVAACDAVGGLDRRACRSTAEERFSSRAMAIGYLNAYAAVLNQLTSTDPIPMFRPTPLAEPLPA